MEMKMNSNFFAYYSRQGYCLQTILPKFILPTVYAYAHELCSYIIFIFYEYSKKIHFTWKLTEHRHHAQ